MDSILIADENRRYVDANPGCELLGVDHSPITKYRIDDFAAPALREHIDEAWAAFLRDGTQRGEYEFIRTDGSVRFVEYSATANFVPGFHLSSLRDITPRKLAQESLRALSARPLHLQDDERRHVARDLHDSVGQDLMGLLLGFGEICREIQTSNPEVAAKIFHQMETLRHVSDQLRTSLISYILHCLMISASGPLCAGLLTDLREGAESKPNWTSIYRSAYLLSWKEQYSE